MSDLKTEQLKPNKFRNLLNIASQKKERLWYAATKKLHEQKTRYSQSRIAPNVKPPATNHWNYK